MEKGSEKAEIFQGKKKEKCEEESAWIVINVAEFKTKKMGGGGPL